VSQKKVKMKRALQNFVTQMRHYSELHRIPLKINNYNEMKMMFNKPFALLLVVLLNLYVAKIYAQNGINAEITGELKKWHKITLTFDGPETSEMNKLNPFMNYRFDVFFTHKESGKTLKVPGYFAADGNAGETSATSGNKWRAHFAPEETGEWTYKVDFRKGNWQAVSERKMPAKALVLWMAQKVVLQLGKAIKQGTTIAQKAVCNMTVPAI
jgi:hypothetical protein